MLAVSERPEGTYYLVPVSGALTYPNLLNPVHVSERRIRTQPDVYIYINDRGESTFKAMTNRREDRT
jgi:hypothetical protein